MNNALVQNIVNNINSQLNRHNRAMRRQPSERNDAICDSTYDKALTFINVLNTTDGIFAKIWSERDNEGSHRTEYFEVKVGNTLVVADIS